jgi:hypothetical protein
MRKKFSSRVLPGVPLTSASPWRLHKVLIVEDLPTLDRPTKAISGGPGGGHPDAPAALTRNSATRIST